MAPTKRPTVGRPSKRSAGSEERPEYRVNVLERAIMILHSFSLSNPTMSLSEVSARTGLHPSTATRLLATLQRHGLVSRDETTNRFSLGYELLSLAEIARSSSSLATWSEAVMRKLRDRFNETVFISVREGDFRIDIEQMVGLQDVRRVVSTGVAKPLYIAATSKVLLAAMPDDEIDAYLARTELVAYGPHTFTNPDALREEIRHIRAAGYAESAGEHNNTGGMAIAAPIFDGRGNAVGALSVTVPAYRMTEELKSGLIRGVVAGAAEIRANLGRPLQTDRDRAPPRMEPWGSGGAGSFPEVDTLFPKRDR